MGVGRETKKQENNNCMSQGTGTTKEKKNTESDLLQLSETAVIAAAGFGS